MIHSFAKVWLDHLGNHIYINNKDFFSINLPEVKEHFLKEGVISLDENGKTIISPLKTYVYLGQELLNPDEVVETSNISYKDIQTKFGLTIYRKKCEPNNPDHVWYSRQQHILFIAQRQQGIPFSELPEGTFASRGLRIECDKARQRIRGVGEGFGTINGRYKDGNQTPWINYNQQNKRGGHLNYLVKRHSYSSITEDLVNKWSGNKKQMNYALRLKDKIIVMRTEDGELLCMPKPQKHQALPRMLIVGVSGKGKSLFLNSILGRVFYVFEHRVVLLNDSLNQFYDLSLPMDTPSMILDLKRYGNVPKCLPTINLYVSGPNVDIKYKEEHVGYRLVLSLKYFLKYWDYYAKGIDTWDIGSPRKYLSEEIINQLNRLDNIEAIRNYLFAKFAQIQGDGKELEKGKREMIIKWCGALDYILRDRFTSNLFHNEETTAAYWKVKTPTEEIIAQPCIAAYEAGLIPVINNHLVKDKMIAKKNLANLMRNIVKWQMLRGKDKRYRVWVMPDELRDFLDENKRDEMYKALDYLFTQGRLNDIGFCGSIQEYSKTTNSMRNNTTHLICFELQTQKERKAVADDFQMDKAKLDSLATLKQFQCLFVTKQKMILYDKDGHQKVAKDGGMWRGWSIPPISKHISPG